MAPKQGTLDKVETPFRQLMAATSLDDVQSQLSQLLKVIFSSENGEFVTGEDVHAIINFFVTPIISEFNGTGQLPEKLKNLVALLNCAKQQDEHDLARLGDFGPTSELLGKRKALVMANLGSRITIANQLIGGLNQIVCAHETDIDLAWYSANSEHFRVWFYSDDRDNDALISREDDTVTLRVKRSPRGDERGSTEQKVFSMRELEKAETFHNEAYKRMPTVTSLDEHSLNHLLKAD